MKTTEMHGIHVPVFPPGPKSQATLSKVGEVIGNANYSGLFGITLIEGRSYYIKDEDENVYLDCLSCAASAILGYGQEFLADAYYHQAKKIQHTCFTYSPNLANIKLAEKLIALAPGDYPKKVMIGLSGSDSSGGAVKATRMYTKKPKIIHFKNDYHGSTGISQEASDFGKINDGIYTKDENFIEFDFPDTQQEAEIVSEKIETALKDKAGGIICESIQGDAGIKIPPPGFMARLREITKNTGTILIMDEVQSGMGRTGKLWAFEHEGIVPDLFVVGKGLSAGYAPISAVIGRKDVLDSLKPAQHIFTYGGHPPSAAVATAVLEYVESANIPQNAHAVGSYLIDKLQKVAAEFNSVILDVRGKGLMIGMQINISTDALAGKVFATRCVELGIYVGFLGINADVVRIEPPLTINHEAAHTIDVIVRQVANEMLTNNIPEQTRENVKKYSIGL